MKVLFVGLGSIGKRHVRNMAVVTSQMKIPFEAYALRSTVSSLENDIAQHIREVYTDSAMVPDDFDVAFITNPTSLHYKTIVQLRGKAKHLLIEKPIFESLNYDISEILPENIDSQYYVACPLRHTLLFQKLQTICSNIQVHSVRAICSSYLPDWRPGIDYRKTYSAQTHLGGGVDLDLIHELDYLTALFSFPDKIRCLKGNYSSLELDCCDTACYIAEYKDKLLELHLDYFGVVPRREVELYTDDDVIVADFTKQQIRWSKKGETIYFKEERDEWCQRELHYFIQLCQGVERKNINDISHAYHVLKLAIGEK